MSCVVLFIFMVYGDGDGDGDGDILWQIICSFDANTNKGYCLAIL